VRFWSFQNAKGIFINQTVDVERVRVTMAKTKRTPKGGGSEGSEHKENSVKGGRERN